MTFVEFFGLNSYMDWLTLFGFIILGILNLVQLFNKHNKERRNEENNIEDRVMKLLETERGLQDKKIADQDAKISDLQTQVTKLKAENEILKNVLNGKDPETIKYRDKVKLVMEQAIEVFKKVEFLNSATPDILKSIHNLSTLMEKHLSNEEKLIEVISSHRK